MTDGSLGSVVNMFSSPSSVASMVASGWMLPEKSTYWAFDKAITVLSKYINENLKDGDIVQVKIKDKVVGDIFKIQTSLDVLRQADLLKAAQQLKQGLGLYMIHKRELAQKELAKARDSAEGAFRKVSTLKDRIECCRIAVVAALWEMDEDPEAAVVLCLNMLEALHRHPQTWKTFSADSGSGIMARLMGQVAVEERKEVLGMLCSLNLVTYSYLTKRGVKFVGENFEGVYYRWPVVPSPSDPSASILPLRYCLNLREFLPNTTIPAPSTGTAPVNSCYLEHVIPCFPDHTGLVLLIWNGQRVTRLYNVLTKQGQNFDTRIHPEHVSVNDNHILLLNCQAQKAHILSRNSLEEEAYKGIGPLDKDFLHAAAVLNMQEGQMKFLYQDGVIATFALNDTNAMPEKVVIEKPECCPTFDTFPAEMDQELVYHNVTGNFAVTDESHSVRIRKPLASDRGVYIFSVDTGSQSDFITSESMKAANITQLSTTEGYLGVLSYSMENIEGSAVEVYDKKTKVRMISLRDMNDQKSFQSRTIFRMAQKENLLAILTGCQLSLWEMRSFQMMASVPDVSQLGAAHSWPTCLAWVEQSYLIVGFSNGDLCRFRILG